MKWQRKFWKPLAICIGVLFLTVLTQCHFVALPFRTADAVISFKTTGYCACKSCCSWKVNWAGVPVYASGTSKGKRKTIGQTASGTMARPGTVAVDPKKFPFGTRFYIPGYGRGVARDVGGAIQGHHLDLYHWTHQGAKRWGVKTLAVKVWYPK
jgi:3D (Asp-Asp-Asp) domain-containing protein